jgi:hypothetical protein
VAIRAELAAQGSVERPEGCMLWQGYQLVMTMVADNRSTLIYFYLSADLSASTCDSGVLTKTRFDVRETADATVPSMWPSEQNLRRRSALRDQKALCNGWVMTVVAAHSCQSTRVYFWLLQREIQDF